MLLIICLLIANPVLAADTRYRIEVLVLTHLHHDHEPQELNRLDDFSTATDFLTPPAEEESEEEDAKKENVAEEKSEDEPGEVGDTAVAEELLEEPDPNALVHVEEMSGVMREAWRRLRLSAPFRPEQYLSWEQGSEAPFPTLRVHDLEVIMVDDPYAELRLELLEQALGTADDGEQTTVYGDAAGLDAINEAEEPGLPDPALYYRLDGAVTLTRTRFLHLGLDLRLREALWEDQDVVAGTVDDTESEPSLPTAFLVQNLQMSRQVKTRRMEYFDHPVLGVLAYITEIKTNTVDKP